MTLSQQRSNSRGTPVQISRRGITGKKGMTILQINLNRSKAAQDLAYATATNMCANLIIASEPNIAHVRDNQRWITDNKIDAAIYCTDPGNNISKRGKGNGFVWGSYEGVTIFSCYITRNCSMETYREFLSDLDGVIRRTPGDKLVMGDFNAKSTEWGGQIEDARGTEIREMTMANNLLILNEGATPTFDTGTRSSFIDLTFASDGLLRRGSSWRVLDGESLSDHRYIEINLGVENTENSRSTVTRTIPQGNRWNTNKMHKARAIEMWKRVEEEQKTWQHELDETATKICETTMPKRTRRNNIRKPIYWWSQEIKNARDECTRAKRELTKARSKGKCLDEETVIYKRKKHELNKMIKIAKKEAWKRTVDQLDRDQRGKGYHIAMKSFHKQAPSNLRPAEERKVVAALFPRGSQQEVANIITNITTASDITADEMKNAAKNMQIGKAPGLDGIPAEIVKMAVEHAPTYTLREINKIWRKGEFPIRYKVARIILLKKPGKNHDEPSAYRPISLLSNVGKLIERIIQTRLTKEIDEIGGLSDRQYGFRRGKSTIEALKRVHNIAENEKNKSRRTRGMCTIVSFDVENAFNSAPWDLIKNKLRNMGVSDHMRKILNNYLSNRAIVLSSGELIAITRGVPQGSVLGPTLWNLMYDDVLRLEMPRGCSTVAYADDLALTITGRTTHDVERAGNEAIAQIAKWMNDHRLKLATHKTEAIMIAGKKRIRTPTLKINNERIKMVPQLRYLGVTLDPHLSYGPHVTKIAEKANKLSAALERILPNISGPSQMKRKVYAGVVTSILTYAITVWKGALRIQKYKRMLERVQRKISIKILRAYRTIRHSTALAVAGVIPIKELAQERTQTWRKNKKFKEEERVRTLSRWENEWRRSNGGEWTKSLITDLTGWIQRSHGEVNYQITQILTGHGCFGSYLHRFKIGNLQCMYCGQIDTPEHTIVQCRQWKDVREKVERVTGRPITTPLADIMLESSEKWEAVAEFLTHIMTLKELEARRRQGHEERQEDY